MTLSDSPLRVRAFAKINLSLQVLGTRPDGYHELRTVFQTLALHDTLQFAQRRGPFAIACSDPGCPADRGNLVWRAAEQVWRASGRSGVPHGVQVRLRKRIPLAGGLGGGSSDAAAALRALGRLWRVDPAVLGPIAASLGADVPFFFVGGKALGLDRGDVLFSLSEDPRAWVLLGFPPFGISTVEAFGWWDNRRTRRKRPSLNDLEPVVAARHPMIARLVAALEGAGAHRAAMSGSGSTVFGLFTTKRAADAAHRSLARRHAGVRWLTTRTLGRVAHERLTTPYV
jgi:4-diphosphocytidyl-2-C-methyl-D-erythritol kinase